MEVYHSHATPLLSELGYIKISEELMVPTDAILFQAVAARIHFMVQDRPDLSVTRRKLFQCMHSPSVGCDTLIKRAIRYSQTSFSMYQSNVLARGPWRYHRTVKFSSGR